MNKLITVLATLVVGVGMVAAQPSISTFRIHGSVGLPSAPDEFKDFYENGYGGGAGIGIGFTNMFTLLLSGEYVRYDLSEDDILASFGASPGQASIEGGEATIIMLTADIKLSLPSPGLLKPYAIAGGGLFRFSAEDFTVSGGGLTFTGSTDSETKLGYGFGAGVDIGLAGIGVFAEGRYMVGLTEDENTGFVIGKVGFILKR